MEYEYIYIFVRKDLTPEQIVVQSAHAALEAGRNFIHDTRRYKIVCLGIKSLPKLENVIKELAEAKIEHTIFCEPDLAWQKTSVATQPLNASQRQLFARYKLLSIATD